MAGSPRLEMDKLGHRFVNLGIFLSFFFPLSVIFFYSAELLPASLNLLLKQPRQ